MESTCAVGWQQLTPLAIRIFADVFDLYLLLVCSVAILLILRADVTALAFAQIGFAILVCRLQVKLRLNILLR
jgi:hypothetical protein